MRSKRPRSTARTIFAVFMPLLLASFATQLAQAQTFKVLHTFHGPNGANPVGALTIDAAGNIYGTTRVGGAGRCTGGTGCGTAFKLGSNGKQIWLYKFNGSDGDVPYSELLRNSSGSLLGTTGGGGDLSCNPPYGCGTVFTLDKLARGKKCCISSPGLQTDRVPMARSSRTGPGTHTERLPAAGPICRARCSRSMLRARKAYCTASQARREVGETVPFPREA
jgi:hypothetical protein